MLRTFGFRFFVPAYSGQRYARKDAETFLQRLFSFSGPGGLQSRLVSDTNLATSVVFYCDEFGVESGFETCTIYVTPNEDLKLDALNAIGEHVFAYIEYLKKSLFKDVFGDFSSKSSNPSNVNSGAENSNSFTSRGAFEIWRETRDLRQSQFKD